MYVYPHPSEVSLIIESQQVNDHSLNMSTITYHHHLYQAAGKQFTAISNSVARLSYLVVLQERLITVITVMTCSVRYFINNASINLFRSGINGNIWIVPK